MSALERLPNGRFPAMPPRNGEPTPRELTEEQKQQFLAVIKEQHEAGVELGNVKALRMIGVKGSKRDLAASVDEDLKDLAREARGWNLTAVKAKAWEVALDTSHPSWDRANSRVLRAYDPRFRDDARLEVTGGLDVRTDVADALDRFTSAVAAAAVRRAGRDGADGVAGVVDAGADGGAGVALGRVAGTAESG